MNSLRIYPHFSIKKWGNFEAESQKALKNQGKSNLNCKKYGLKAARRAPQFSKR